MIVLSYEMMFSWAQVVDLSVDLSAASAAEEWRGCHHGQAPLIFGSKLKLSGDFSVQCGPDQG